jgi:hypothetical protein
MGGWVGGWGAAAAAAAAAAAGQHCERSTSQAVELFEELMSITTDKLGPETLLAAAKTISPYCEPPTLPRL